LKNTSKPNDPSVPDEPYYPITRLQRFDWHDRKSWERAFEEQAPPFDKTRPRKHWADPGALDGVKDPANAMVEYDYFDNNSRSFKKLKISAREAATPNLPGAYVFPKYIVAPTKAVIVSATDGVENAFNPRLLCNRSEALQLAREIGGDSVIENTYSPAGPYRIEWRGEQRRMWLIRKNGNYYGAALLLERKYKNGVGAPGDWVVRDDGAPDWIPRQVETGKHDPRPPVPVPSRTLAPNEALYLGHPMKVVVYRTDKESEFNQPDQPASGFPPELRATLNRIDANLQQLLALALTSPD